jgi:RNA recognition motif-containing protein
MKSIFIGNLASHTSEEELTELLSNYGTVRKIEMPKDIFSHKNKGFAIIGMEGHEARAAMAGLNGKSFHERPLKIREEKAKSKAKGRRRR